MLHTLLSIAPYVVALALAVLTAAGLARAFGAPPTTGRLVSLDGLRGYLALSVFVHHAMMWRHYLQRGVWGYAAGDLALYQHLGEDSVTLFFMMTGFLFGAKLAEGRVRPIDWTRLYVSRVLRIYPLYGLVLVVVLATVAMLTGAALHVPAVTLARRVVSLAHFGRPSLNGVDDAWMITAGVQWSLAYEWLFYSVLPLAALLFGIVPRARWLVASAAATAIWMHWIADVGVIHVGAFVAGVLTSLVTRPSGVRAALGGRAGAIAAIAALVTTVTAFGSGYQWPVLLLLSAVFAVVASGNTLFGALAWTPSRVLGEISYSIYLLHGLLLFAVIRGGVGLPTAAALGNGAYWGLVVALAPVLVVGAFAAFRLVERPAIQATPHAQRWVAARLGAPAQEAPRPVRGWLRAVR